MVFENTGRNYHKFTFLIPLCIPLFIVLSFYTLPGITADGHIYLQIARAEIIWSPGTK